MIPPTRYINAGPIAPQASAGPAMAAGQAVEQIGHALENVGEQGSQIVAKMRRMEEGGKINAFMANADKEAGEFAIGLAQRSDTDAWPKEWQDHTADLRERAKALGLSPEGMAHLDGEFSNWSTGRAIHFETQAATKKLGIAKSQTTQSLEYYAARGDKEGFDRTLRTGTASGILDPADQQAAQMHFDSKAAALDLDKLVDGNPQGLIDEPDESILRTLPGATPEMVMQAKRQAKGVVKERAFDTVEAAQDEIFSNKVTDPKQLDDDPRFKTLRPTVRERLKGNLRQFQADQAEGRMATPEAQHAVIGEVSGLMRDWNPMAEEQADEKYAQITGLISRLPENSAMKGELLRQAKAIRSGAWGEVKTHADAAFKALDDFDKTAAGKLPAAGKITTRSIVDSGFLKDSAKLQRLGFDEGQAEGIVKASKADPSAGQRAFIEGWSKRPGASVNASPIEIAAADAIRLENATIDWNDPASESAAGQAKADHYRESGERRAKLADFLKLNPKATPGEIDEKILGIAGEQTTRNLRSGMYDAKPSRSVSMSTDIKLSNYGYASDSTPDSNSARGIGHADNKLEDGKSAAISKSLADRLNLKTGDEVEIETTKGKFRVRYDDTVPATDERTGDLPETIDIYRKDGANNWSGRVTKITKVS